MSLLKAMAAQIDATSNNFASPSVTQVHLICTFRYESELYAYGDFLHRITHDPQFTTWLLTTLYVSRADKDKLPAACPSGQCGHEGVCERVMPESAQPVPLAYPFPRRPANYGATSTNETKGKPERASPFPGCCPESTGSCSSSSAVCGGGESSAGTRVASAASVERAHGGLSSHKSDYDPLPTFPEMSSASLASVNAKKDLVATTLILFVPLIVFAWSRSIVWDGVRDGQERWCRTTFNFDQRWTNHCLWAYALMPGVFHLALAMAMGYAGLWTVRSSNLLHAKRSSDWNSSLAVSSSAASVSSSSSSLAKSKGDASRTDLETDTLLSAPSVLQPRRLGGLYPEAALSVVSTDPSKHHSIPFKRGRIQVHYHIQELKMAGIGREDALGGASRRKGGVLVFGGGPEAFVEMIEESCKKAEWDVDFCAETWAP